MLQQLWKAEVKWDDPLPQKLENEWIQYKKAMINLENIKISRWISFDQTSDAVELHGFCDASEKAYAAVIYSKIITKDKVTIHLLTAKSKVAPLKSTMTTPRLELCAAELLSKLMAQAIMAMEFQEVTSYFWSDSAIALAWIKGNNQKLKKFIANRITTIRNNTHPSQWNYVKTDENPADCASRGLNASQLKDNVLWWNGPKWLLLPKEKWPTTQLNIFTKEDEIEQRIICTVVFKPDNEIIERFSSLYKASCIIAYCNRFIKACRNKCMKKASTKPKSNQDIDNGKSKEKQEVLPITATELEKSTIQLVRMAQLLEYNEEIDVLQKQKPLHTGSKLLSLNPFIDENGILRVGGRLQLSNLPFNEKHPIILPNKSHLTKLIIRDAHIRTLHGGNQLTRAYLIRKYWILNARSSIRDYIHRCVVCTRHKAKTNSQIMGSLPATRVIPSKPFTHTGVDYAGPINIKFSSRRGYKTYKGYIAIFICMTTKAIHIEVVSDMTSTAFIAAFKRFTARRGLCNHLYSDCGTNFVGAERILNDEILKILQSSKKDIAQSLASDGTNWHFNPPAAPHFGGLWEAGVKSTKFHLKRIIGETILTFEELTTVLAQIEACLNSRPLCPISNDPTDYEALTPGHFLMGRAPVSPPEFEKEDADTTTSYRTRWQLVSKLYKDFWKAWSTEYLSRLQQRPKWRRKDPNITPGQLVLIKDENIPPTKWPLARVTEIHPGQDGIVRVVSLRCKGNTILKRPITKICTLPIDNDMHDVQTAKEEVKSNILLLDRNSQNCQITTVEQKAYPSRKRKIPDIDVSPLKEKKQYTSVVSHQIQKTVNEYTKIKRKGIRIRPVTGYSSLIPIEEQIKRTEEYRQRFKRSIATNERPTKVFRPIETSIFNHTIIMCLIILFLAKLGKSSYNITHPEPGLYIEHVGEAMIRRGTLRIILNYPMNITRDIERVTNTVTQLRQICNNTQEFSQEIHCHQLVDHLAQKQSTLLEEMAILKQKAPVRTKRGILGRILQSIFGVNDEVYADIDNLNQNQLILKHALQHQSALMISTTKAMNDTENRMIQKINLITSKLNSVISEVNKRQEWFAKVDNNKANIQILAACQLANDMIEEIESHYIKLVKITLNKGSLFDFVTPGQLINIIANISTKIPSSLQLIHEPESRIELSIDNMDANVYGYFHITGIHIYTVDKITPIPKRLNDATYLVPDISTSLIATSYNTQTYFELSDNEFAQCINQGNHMYLCNPSVVSNIESNPNCVIDEIYHRQEKIHCTWRKLIAPAIMWKHLYMRNTWLFMTTRPITAAVKCDGVREDANLNGVGIIRTNQGCIIQTKKNTLSSELINSIPIKSTYNKPININISDVLYQTKPKLTQLDLEPVLGSSDQLSRFTIDETLDNGMDTTAWKTIGHHVITGISGVTITIILIVVYKLLKRSENNIGNLKSLFQRRTNPQSQPDPETAPYATIQPKYNLEHRLKEDARPSLPLSSIFVGEGECSYHEQSHPISKIS